MRRVKKAGKLFLSFSFAVLLFFAIQRLVEPKYVDSIPEGNFTSEYYQETTSHDVLMLGDCEVYENFDPIYLWMNYGITSYIRGNAQQLVWQSYYLLEDTLKYENPKVVIYNVQALVYSEPQREEYNRMVLDGMRWSKIKYEAIRASMCENEKMLDYMFPLFRYHQRILDLTWNDFVYYGKSEKVTHNGYYMRVDVLPASQSDVADPSWLLGGNNVEEVIEDPWERIQGADDETESKHGTPFAGNDNDEGDKKFGKYPMKYLNYMRKLCEEKGIQFILIKAPSLAPQWYTSYNEQVKKYAEEHKIPYINFYELLEETGIDYETDTYDGGLHMNLKGADKLSKYLGKVLVQEYGIQDHRKEPDIKRVYDRKIQFYKQMIQKQYEELQQDKK